VAKSVRVLSHNISVLPIYVENKELLYRNEKNQNDNVPINFLTVCRLEKEKDLDTAILAFKIVSESFPEATFTIVGDGREMEKLENLSKIYNLTSKIFFVGWQNNLEEFYKKADIYISTSLYEGYGMSTVEAAFHGLPLVLSDTGLATYLFVSGESALVCKQRDVDAFANAMLRLVRNSSLRHQMGAKALEWAEKDRISFGEYLEKFKISLIDAVTFNISGNGIFKKNILVRYFVAGVIGAGTQIGSLFIFTDIFKIWYLYSSILSFVVAIVISFTLQKFWTFKDNSTKKIHYQFAKYILVASLGLVLNTILMFILVDFISIWYIFAQIIAGAIIAVINFIMYKFFIFNR
jgi:putative flippase GtrA